jgi:hypothetical protein
MESKKHGFSLLGYERYRKPEGRNRVFYIRAKISRAGDSPTPFEYFI